MPRIAQSGLVQDETQERIEIALDRMRRGLPPEEPPAPPPPPAPPKRTRKGR